MKITFVLINSLIFFSLFSYREIICKKLNLISTPNKKTFHNKKSFLYGGILLFPSFIISYIFITLNLDENLYLNFFLIFSFFILALMDDIFNLKPLFKIFFCSIFLIFSIYYDSTLTLYSLNSYFFGLLVFSDNLFIIYVFPVLCILLLINAFNFIDGINCLASLIGLSFLTYTIFKNFEILNYIYPFLIFILVFMFFNLRKSIFLGDSGNYLISIIFGTILIKENYHNPEAYYAEEIFLLLFIPGIDMLRLFVTRIYNKKSPFNGDNNHFHHLVFYRFGFYRTLIIYFFIVNLPLYIFNYLGSYLLLIFSVTLYLYIYLIYIGSLNKYKAKI